MSGQKERLMQFITYLGITVKAFETEAGLSNGFVSKVGDAIRQQRLDFISNAYQILNIDWLQTGYGEMLNDSAIVNEETIIEDSKLVPFYDDVVSIKGKTGLVEGVEPVIHSTARVDVGDWFRDAKVAIRHYGDSMVEYPPGCILAIREVNARHLIVWGKDYVIETNEYRITKRVQKGIDSDSINEETYSNGRLVHEPIDIQMKDIRYLYMILGCIVRTGGKTIIYQNI